MTSVIVPNYNHNRFIEKRIQSILSQHTASTDIIFLDDNSTDGSREYLESCSVQNNAVKLIFNQVNSGSTFYQWNKGVQIAKNDLIWVAESDDYASPSFIDRVAAPLLSDPDIVLSFCQSYRADHLDNITGTCLDEIEEINQFGFSSDFIMDGKEFITKFLIHKNTIPNASAVIFRKNIYELVDGAPEDQKTNGDWLTWLKILCYGKVAFIAEPLNYFRYHDTSVIGKLKHANNSNNYLEQYDGALRKKFKKYLNENKIYIDPKTKFINNQYISYDDGNEAIYLFEKKKILKALPLLFFSTFWPKFKSGYLKKILFK